VQYAASGSVQVAYQVTGEGPVDVVWAPGTVSHLDLDWDWPPRARFIEALSSFCRLIRFDKRGTGLSDRPTSAATLEERTDDIRAVMDAAGSDRAAIFGVSEGGSIAVLFAATHPERTRCLITWGCQATWIQTEDYPWGLTPEESGRKLEMLRRGWPSREYLLGWGAGLGKDVDPAFLEWFMHYAQSGASPAAIVALEELNDQIDVRDILPSVRVPALVMNRTGDPVANVEAAKDLASRIPGARFVEFPGESHMLDNLILPEIREFVTGSRAPFPTGRVLATILFVDLVGSTHRAVEIGDAAWRDLLQGFYRMANAELLRFEGREVDRAGDGLVATFDGPTRAIRCAHALQRGAADLGVGLRAGVHTGEVETIDRKVGGLAVVIGARIGALAGSSEILASSTVKDLTAGSGLSFENAGEHELKGVPDRWRLYRVTE
jgi:pimeloyl-ACP methyl ester carboxylesterase